MVVAQLQSGDVEALAADLLNAAECATGALIVRDAVAVALAERESCDAAVAQALDAAWQLDDLHAQYGENGGQPSVFAQQMLGSLNGWCQKNVRGLRAELQDGGEWDSLRTGLLKLVLLPSVRDPNAQHAVGSLPGAIEPALNHAGDLAANTKGEGYGPPDDRDILGQQIDDVRHHALHLYVLQRLLWHLAQKEYEAPAGATWQTYYEHIRGDERFQRLLSFAGELRQLEKVIRRARAYFPEAIRTGEFGFLETILSGESPNIPASLRDHAQLEIERKRVEDAKQRRSDLAAGVRELVCCLRYQRAIDRRPWGEAARVEGRAEADRPEQDVGEAECIAWAVVKAESNRKGIRCPLDARSLVHDAQDRLARWLQRDPDDRYGLCEGAASALGMELGADDLQGKAFRETLGKDRVQPLLEEIEEVREWLRPVVQQRAGATAATPNLHADLARWRETRLSADKCRRQGEFDDAKKAIEEAVGEPVAGGKAEERHVGFLRELAAVLRRPPSRQGRRDWLTGMAEMLSSYAADLARKWIDPEIRLAVLGSRSTQPSPERPSDEGGHQTEPALWGLPKLALMRSEWEVRWAEYTQCLGELQQLEGRFVIFRWLGAAEQRAKREECWDLYRKCEEICPDYRALADHADYLGIKAEPTAARVWKQWPPDDAEKGYDEC